MMNSKVLKLVLVLIIALMVMTICGFIKLKAENNAKRFYTHYSLFFASVLVPSKTI